MFRFTHTDTNYAQIIEDGTRIKSLGKDCPYICTTSSTGWEKGTHYWSIKSHGSDPGYQCIGVITNYSDATKYNITPASLGKYLYYDGDNGLISRQGITIANVNGWATGDVIKTTLDCDEWKVTFHKNDELIGTYDIENKNEKYYPVLQMCGCSGHNYKLLCD